MEGVTFIERVFESMNVSTSVLVCSSTSEMDHYLRLLEGKCFTCVFLNSHNCENFLNKIIITMPKQFESVEFWDVLQDKKASPDCVFFTSRAVADSCVEVCTRELTQDKRYFIFNL